MDAQDVMAHTLHLAAHQSQVAAGTKPGRGVADSGYFPDVLPGVVGVAPARSHQLKLRGEIYFACIVADAQCTSNEQTGQDEIEWRACKRSGRLPRLLI